MPKIIWLISPWASSNSWKSWHLVTGILHKIRLQDFIGADLTILGSKDRAREHDTVAGMQWECSRIVLLKVMSISADAKGNGIFFLFDKRQRSGTFCLKQYSPPILWLLGDLESHLSQKYNDRSSNIYIKAICKHLVISLQLRSEDTSCNVSLQIYFLHRHNIFQLFWDTFKLLVTSFGPLITLKWIFSGCSLLYKW